MKTYSTKHIFIKVELQKTTTTLPQSQSGKIMDTLKTAATEPGDA